MPALRQADAIALLTLALAMTVVVSTVSYYLHDRHANAALAADLQLAILERRPFQYQGFSGDVPEFRNRILVPLLVQGVARATPLGETAAYLAVRAFTALLMFAVVARAAGTRRNPVLPLAATAVLALCLVLSFNHSFELPSDYTDVLFTAAFIACAQRRARGWSLIAAVAAATARESAAFAGLIWACCAAERLPRRVAWGGLLSAAAMAVTIGLRALFRLPGAPLVNSLGATHADSWVFLGDGPLGPRTWWVALLAMAALLAWWLRAASQWTRPDRPLLIAAAAIVALSVTIGAANELRIYMPAVTCVLVAGLPARGQSDPENV